QPAGEIPVVFGARRGLKKALPLHPLQQFLVARAGAHVLRPQFPVLIFRAHFQEVLFHYASSSCCCSMNQSCQRFFHCSRRAAARLRRAISRRIRLIFASASMIIPQRALSRARQPTIASAATSSGSPPSAHAENRQRAASASPRKITFNNSQMARRPNRYLFIAASSSCGFFFPFFFPRFIGGHVSRVTVEYIHQLHQGPRLSGGDDIGGICPGFGHLDSSLCALFG